MIILRSLCEKYHISQEELAGKIGKSQSLISKLISGEKRPSIQTAQDIAKTFGVTVDYLLGGTHETKKTTRSKKTQS